MSTHLSIAEELHRNHTLKVEEWLRLRVKPKPKGWPDSLWRWALRKLICLERTGIKFDEGTK